MTEEKTKEKDQKAQNSKGKFSDGGKYEIDANGKKLGRVASEAVSVLLGKNTPDFVKHRAANVEVVINNASKMDLAERKATQKVYTRYSGYPGGLKKETATEVIKKKGHSEIVKKAVYGMLPGNKLRKERMKHLTINN